MTNKILSIIQHRMTHHGAFEYGGEIVIKLEKPLPPNGYSIKQIIGVLCDEPEGKIKNPYDSSIGGKNAMIKSNKKFKKPNK